MTSQVVAIVKRVRSERRHHQNSQNGHSPNMVRVVVSLNVDTVAQIQIQNHCFQRESMKSMEIQPRWFPTLFRFATWTWCLPLASLSGPLSLDSAQPLQVFMIIDMIIMYLHHDHNHYWYKIWIGIMHGAELLGHGAGQVGARVKVCRAGRKKQYFHIFLWTSEVFAKNSTSPLQNF